MLKAYHTEESGKRGVAVEAEGTALELKAELDALIDGTLGQFITQTEDEATEGLILMMILGVLHRHVNTTMDELKRLQKEAKEKKVRNGIKKALDEIEELGNDQEKAKEKATEMCPGFMSVIEEGLQEKKRAEEMEEEMARKILEDEK